MNRMYGYARVSSTEQNLDRQIEALTAYGVEDWRTDSYGNNDKAGIEKNYIL